MHRPVGVFNIKMLFLCFAVIFTKVIRPLALSGRKGKAAASKLNVRAERGARDARGGAGGGRSAPASSMDACAIRRGPPPPCNPRGAAFGGGARPDD